MALCTRPLSQEIRSLERVSFFFGVFHPSEGSMRL